MKSRNWELGGSHTRHCRGCGTQDTSQLSELPEPMEGLAQGFQPYKQLLGQSPLAWESQKRTSKPLKIQDLRL